MFELTEQDKETLAQKAIVPRIKISDKDLFMNKPKTLWQPFHKPIACTEDILESLEPYETRKITDLSFLDRFTDQEKRYYTN